MVCVLVLAFNANFFLILNVLYFRSCSYSGTNIQKYSETNRKKLLLLVQDLDKSSALLFYIMHTLYIYLYTVDDKNWLNILVFFMVEDVYLELIWHQLGMPNSVSLPQVSAVICPENLKHHHLHSSQYSVLLIAWGEKTLFPYVSSTKHVFYERCAVWH